ncbi:MAG: dihydrodipicolinate synthase family protein [Planctomycetota bacterium]
MDTSPITPARLASSVIAVPPLARASNLSLDFEQNRRIVEYIEAGGVSTFLYGGNAVLYHIRLSEYARLLEMLTQIAGERSLIIPSVGPAFGTMMDQAEVLKDFDFPTVMILPQKDIADSQGIASGIKRFVEAYGKPVVLYLKHDHWLPPETVSRMFEAGYISWIKYAVVRENTIKDSYLSEVLASVPSNIVVSGIGEQPAIIHMRDFQVGSFTSGCVCVNPAKSMAMMQAIRHSDFTKAETIREQFEPLEDLRNGINPIRVLHRALELAEIAETGPMFPMLGELEADEVTSVAQAASRLRDLT